MARAYAGFETRFTARTPRFSPAAPPKSNAIDKWKHDKGLRKKRNKIERFFRRIKAFRAVFTRHGKLDVIFEAAVRFAAIVILLRVGVEPASATSIHRRFDRARAGDSSIYISRSHKKS
jgi:hypothetical protein